MKLSIKKTYCPTCGKLVKGQESSNNGSVSITCPNCTNTIWVRDGNIWKYAQSKNRKKPKSKD